MDRTEKLHILRTFLLSEEMTDYLSGADLPEEAFADVVVGAPLPLETKARYARGEDKVRIEQALRELTLLPGELFSLTDAWYDLDSKDVKTAENGLFLSFENALSAIRGEQAACGDGEEPGDCQWYTLKKWVPDGLGSLVNTFAYTLLEDKPIFFRKRRGERENVTLFDDRFGGCIPALDLPVPFAVGNVLRVDCRPFFPPLPALLLEKGDNRDCCCLQVLYRDTNGAWRTAALKHGLLLKTLSGEPCFAGYRLSPLYRLAKWTGELPSDCARLPEMQKFLNGDEANGKKLWETLNGC